MLFEIKWPSKYFIVFLSNATLFVWICEIFCGPNLSVKLITKNYLDASVVAFEYCGACYITIFTYLECFK